MNISPADLARQYLAALREYLAKSNERALHRAYELGRKTIAAGLGVMDLAQAHQQAIVALAGEGQNPAETAQACHLAGDFFTESLWSFEMTHRGFREANGLLRDLNATLEERARQLATANTELKGEITERRRVEQALRESEERQRHLSKQVLIAQEEERKRISRELHDEVGQALTAININLTMLKNSLVAPGLADKVADVQALLEQSMVTIHDFTRELRPSMLDHLGLVPTLRSYVRNFGRRTGLRVRFSAVPEVEQLGMEEKTVLYRVTQEGLTNVARHAKARDAAVSIRRANGSIRMEVRDNGQAFKVDENLGPSHRKRLGLLGIEERVRLVNGVFKLTSLPGKGTTIRVEIPLKNSGAKFN